MLILKNPMRHRLNLTGSRNGYGPPSAAIKFGAQYAYEKPPFRRYVRELESVNSDPTGISPESAPSRANVRLSGEYRGIEVLALHLALFRVSALFSNQGYRRLADTH